MMERGKRALVALWSVQGIGTQALRRLRDRLPVEQWLDAPLGEVIRGLGVGSEVTTELEKHGSMIGLAEALEKTLAQTRQNVCFRGDLAYPPALVDAAGAPPLLFYRGPGAVAQVRQGVALVGSRHTTHEWLEFTARLATDCVEQNLVVVSGAAEGVDTAAHEGAMRGRGVTWAFMASGLDQLDTAPRQVAEKVLVHGGTVFSECPPGARPDKGLFVRRNRLVSGSSGAVVVVRGKASSGTRHTAEAAQRQARVVLAVPGFDAGAAVCRVLLRGGARACFDVSDVLLALGLVSLGASPRVADVRGPVSTEAQQVFQALPTGLFELEQALHKMPKAGSSEVAAALMELEIAGWLVTRTGRRYEKRE